MIKQEYNLNNGSEVDLNRSKVGDMGYFVLKCHYEDSKSFKVINSAVVTSGELVFSTRDFNTNLLNGCLSLDIISGKSRSIAYLVINPETDSTATVIEYCDPADLIENINSFIEGLNSDEPYHLETEEDRMFADVVTRLQNLIRLFYGLPSSDDQCEGISFLDLNH